MIIGVTKSYFEGEEPLVVQTCDNLTTLISGKGFFM